MLSAALPEEPAWRRPLSCGDTGAAADPLPVDPWSMGPGEKIPPYGVPAKYEKVVRTLFFYGPLILGSFFWNAGPVARMETPLPFALSIVVSMVRSRHSV